MTETTTATEATIATIGFTAGSILADKLVEFSVLINQPSETVPPVFGIAFIRNSEITAIQEIPVPGGGVAVMILTANNNQFFTLEDIRSVAAKIDS